MGRVVRERGDRGESQREREGERERESGLVAVEPALDGPARVRAAQQLVPRHHHLPHTLLAAPPTHPLTSREAAEVRQEA